VGGGVDPGLRAIVDHLPAPVIVVAVDGRIIYVNQAAADIAGQPASWLSGRRLLDFVHPPDRQMVRRRLRSIASRQGQTRIATYRLRANSAQGWREVEAFATNLLEDQRVKGILIAGRDVTDERAYQRQLHDAAYRDPLTAIPNRRELNALLDKDLKAAAPFAVAFVGLDRFKLVNDSLGHSTGDAVLIAAASRITQSLPQGGSVFRFNGDVFAVTVPGAAAGIARDLIWRVIERISEPLFLAGHELRLSASAGIVLRDESSTTELLLRNAALALHSAKVGGRGRVEKYDPAMSEAAAARLELEANLRRALSRSELSLALQPIVEIASGRAVGAEALVRWNDGTTDVPPATFIPVAEESGLIIPLGDWIIDHAASHASLVPGGCLHVNLSGRQLASPGLRFRIAQAISSHGLSPGELGFELTESVLIEQFDHAVTALHVIRDLGCRVGLDDFGTGYSSLSYLRRLPIDFLKVDRQLIADVHSDSQARAIVGAIVTMAQALGLDVIAEGVEDHAQATVLQDLGCEYAQGFLYGRPAAV
jgi:diguanylate cyclase (GGDEF)-like protein/PAS domain S-box-containing protein